MNTGKISKKPSKVSLQLRGMNQILFITVMQPSYSGRPYLQKFEHLSSIEASWRKFATAVVCANLTGTHTIPAFVIAQYKNSQCLYKQLHMNTIPINYFSQKKKRGRSYTLKLCYTLFINYGKGCTAAMSTNKKVFVNCGHCSVWTIKRTNFSFVFKGKYTIF